MPTPLWLPSDPKAPSIWIPRASPIAMRRGLARDLQEQKCEDGYADVVAPKCPACGKPVADKDWEKHKYEDHGMNQVCQPYGKADSREVIFLGPTPDYLEKKKAIWRDRHPGLTLELAAEGKEPRFRNIIFQRYRICTAAGKPVD